MLILVSDPIFLRREIRAMSCKQRYYLKIAYDGSNYAGWQIQPEQKTVQGEIERVLGKLSGERVRIHGSGRTDSGVHAREQVAHFDLRQGVDSARFEAGANSLLPPDIRIAKAQKTAPDFHARRDALGKEYRYFIWTGRVLPPFIRNYRFHCDRDLNLEEMRLAAAQLIGEHDFASFCCASERHDGARGTVRTLNSVELEVRGAELMVVVGGNGFLYKMVRSIVGFLVQVGSGHLSASDTVRILAARKRTRVVPSAPPEGLFLWKVFYPEDRLVN